MGTCGRSFLCVHKKCTGLIQDGILRCFRRSGAAFLSDEGTDDKYRSDGQDDGSRQADEGVGHEAGQQEGQEGNDCHSSCIGQLSCHMLHVIAPGSGGRHNGGIRNRRAVVAADSTGKAGRDAHKEQGAGFRENAGDDGDQDSEGAPGGAGGKGQAAGHDKDDGGQEVKEAGSRRLHDAVDIFSCLQDGCHVFEAGCQGQDQDGGNHGVESLGDAAHGIAEGDDAAADQVADDEKKGNDAAPGKAHKGIRVGKGACKITCKFGRAAQVCAEEAAHKEQAAHAADHQDHDGKNQVDDLALSTGCRLIFQGFFFGTVVLDALHGLQFKLGHLAVVEAHDGNGHDEHQGHEGIEVERNCTDKELQAAVGAVFHAAGNGGGPGGNGGDHAHGSSRCIDEIGKLDTGYLLAVREGTHDGADGQAVKIVVDKNEDAQSEGRKAGTCLGLHMGGSPAAEGLGAADLVHKSHDDAKHNEENKDAGVALDGLDEAVIDNSSYGACEGKIAVHQSAENDAHEQ